MAPAPASIEAAQSVMMAKVKKGDILWADTPPVHDPGQCERIVRTRREDAPVPAVP